MQSAADFKHNAVTVQLLLCRSPLHHNTDACGAYMQLVRDCLLQYMGVWYELAYHDWTQYAICGCTRFNMTQRAHTIEDMFTTKCPKNEPLLGQTYAVNMSMAVNPATPGQFLEKAFYTDWPNMVLDVWGKSSSSDGARAGSVSASNSGSSSGSGKSYYKKAIQMQCLEVSDNSN
jgi:hypothetical protein